MERFQPGTTRDVPLQAKAYDFAAYCACLAAAKGDALLALDIAKGRGYETTRTSVARTIKAAINAGTTSDASFASSLVSEMGPMVANFLQALAPRTILGRLTGLARVPFETRVGVQTDTAAGSWVAEGEPAPPLEPVLTHATLTRTKIVAPTILSDELVRSAGQASVQFVANALLRMNARTLDQSFIDPTLAAVANTNPASVTYGATAVASTGSTVATITTDANDCLHQMVDVGSDLQNAVWVMHPRTSAYLSTLPGSGGAPAFPTMGAAGGSWFGLPALVSSAVPVVGSPATTTIALIDPTRILLADDGELTADASREAALQMRTDPQTGETTVYSLWQLGQAAVKTVRTINWSAQAGAAAIISGVAY